MKWLANPACCQVRDCPQQFITSCQYFNRGMPGEIIEIETIAELGTDEVAWILSFLPLEKIMCLRRVNITWKEAAKKTTVPPTDFAVDDVKKYNATEIMTRALPNLQQIHIGNLGSGNKYNDGEDPDEEYADAARSAAADWTVHDIEIISHFSKLRIFCITGADLNGRYPFLFNSFPLLQKLSLDYCIILKWDLDMLAGFPLLKELYCYSNCDLTGNISSLRVLKDTLEKVDLPGCQNVEGNFMDLADFPHLKILVLEETDVTGDIRDIGVNDFASLECLILPKGVYGGSGYELQRISDAPDLVRSLYLLKNQRPTIKLWLKHWYAKLSEDSPDWYESADATEESTPFYISFIEAGSRLGYRWEADRSTNTCEVNWLDPEPETDSREYGDPTTLYRGYYEPPTEEEYNLLFEERLAEIDAGEWNF